MPIEVVGGVLCNVSPREELEVLSDIATDINRAISRLDLLYSKQFPDWTSKECQSRVSLTNAGLCIYDVMRDVRIAIESQEESYVQDGKRIHQSKNAGR